MRQLYFRTLGALKLAVWAFKNPKTLNVSNFRMLSDLLALIFKVSTENRHMMTHVAYINPIDGSEQQIVSIWAGAGVAAEPTKRIAELISENETLKSMLLMEQLKKGS